MSQGKQKKQSSDGQIIVYELIGLTLIALSLIMLVSIYVMSKGYITYDSNPGAIGGILVRIAEGLMGNGKLLLPFFLFYLGLRYIRDNIGIKYDLRTLGIVMLVSAFLMVLHINITFISYSENLTQAFNGAGGGLIGALFILLFRTFFGLWGTWIIAVTFFIAGIMMLTGLSLKKILGKMQSSTHDAWHNNKETLFDLLFVEEEISTTAVDTLPRAEEEIPNYQKRKKNLLIDMSDHDTKKRNHLYPVDLTAAVEEKEDNEERPHLVLVHAESTDEEQIIDTEIKFKDSTSKNIQEVKVPEREMPHIVQSRTLGSYQLPPLNLLDANLTKNKTSQKDITARVSILEQTIQSFGIDAKVIQVSCGPTVTRFELDIPPGVKVSKITGLADNIALRLAAKGVRISPIPDQATIGIEVPNKEISAVGFREVLEDNNYLKSSSKLSFALGKDISGRAIVTDLSKMPHLLIAGTTGSGKSVCMNTLICSILFKSTPKEVRLLMIDPKMVELASYNGIPHLLAPVVTDPKKAAAVLKWMVTEMDNRYEMFAQSNVRDIVRYNKQKEASGNDLQHMPYYVVIIDELADLMMVASHDVEEAICRIAQKARAAGIHLVVATQRPSVDVITGLIKANIPSRIAFAVSSSTDSRTILDTSGAEKLLGRGDMLFHPVGEQSPIRIQGAFVSDKEVENIVSFLKNASSPQYDEKVMGVEAVKTEEKNDDTVDDVLFFKAGVTLIEAGQASASMLQRRIRVGYARAARLIDILEERNVIGPHEGSKPRQILMDIEEFETNFGDQKQED